MSWKKKLKNSYEENETNVSKNMTIDQYKNISSKALREILTKKDF